MIKKIEALNLNKSDIFNAISTLSYIFPVGKIEGNSKHYYLSTYNGAKTSQAFANTLIKIGDKNVYLRDIAFISKKNMKTLQLFTHLMEKMPYLLQLSKVKQQMQ